MLTVIAYHPTGYEVRIEMESEKLDTTIRWLEKHNYRPVREMNGNPGSHGGGAAKTATSEATGASINDDLFGD